MASTVDDPALIEKPSPASFAAFNITETAYKHVNNTPVPASVLVPKTIQPGVHPIVVRWHGGGLITGHRLFPDWCAAWNLEIPLRNNAILVAPDYRLLPEHSGLDILEDLQDFYTWLLTPGNLDAYLPEGVTGDLDNVLVTGESAGGYMAVQSLLLLPVEQRRHVRAFIAQFPMLDLRSQHWTVAGKKDLFGEPMELPLVVLTEHQKNIKPGQVVSSRWPPEGGDVFACIVTQGVLTKLLGNDRQLYPFDALSDFAAKAKDLGEGIPPLWIIHGTDDTIVPVVETEDFAKLYKEKLSAAKLHLSYRPGGHGFDNGEPFDSEWLQEGVKFIGQAWPKA